MGILVLAQPDDTVQDLATKLQQAASVRVAPYSPVNVRFRGALLKPQLTVRELGIEPLERFDVIRGEAC